MTTQTAITNYINAGYPVIAIATADEDGATKAVLSAMPEALEAKKAWRIAASGGLQEYRTVYENGQSKVKAVELEKAGNYGSSFARAAATAGSLLIVLDFQHLIRNAGPYRQLRDALPAVKSHTEPSLIVLISPSWQFPPEIEHDIPMIHDSLPTRDELAMALAVNQQAVDTTIDDATRTAILDAASGLTLPEAEGAIALSWNGHAFLPSVVADEKMRLVRQSGYLEVSAPAKVEDLGGLGALKEYIYTEVVPTIHEPDLRTRGILLVGVSGGGKSLASKVLGAILQRPVLRADMSALKGSLVGQSEQQMRAMLKLAEAVSPCVLYMDEIN